MNHVDSTIFLALNSWVGSSWTVDYILLTVLGSSLLKGGVLVALLWWSWERSGAERNASTVVRTLGGALVAVAIARAMQNLMPMRPRPLHDPELAERGFLLAHNLPSDILSEWSSFPSDHAVLSFAMAMAVFAAHRGLGVFAFAWALLVSSLPRVYFGLHYPSDILAGAIIGIGIMALARSLPVPQGVNLAVERFAHARRGWFYAGLFLMTYQMATVFAGVRDLAKAGSSVLALLADRI